MLVAAKTSGATPLVIACRNGHYDVAEYLIEKCNADIEQPGSGMYISKNILWFCVYRSRVISNRYYNMQLKVIAYYTA